MYGPNCGSQYKGTLRVGQFGCRIPVGARFSTHVHTGAGSHPVSSTMGNGSLSQG